MMIGITGSIGAGKSMVGNLLRERGCQVVDADKAVHLLYRENAALRAAVVKAFGPQSLTNAGINRTFMANLIFKNEAARELLESLVYPVLIDYILSEKPNFVEAALLEKVPELVKVLDEIWVVDASVEVCLERLMKFRGFSEEDARRRLELQNHRNHRDFWEKAFVGKRIRFIDNSQGEKELREWLDRNYR